jgi:hypothetical protein
VAVRSQGETDLVCHATGTLRDPGPGLNRQSEPRAPPRVIAGGQPPSDSGSPPWTGHSGRQASTGGRWRISRRTGPGSPRWSALSRSRSR